jgi:hypothetical protein
MSQSSAFTVSLVLDVIALGLLLLGAMGVYAVLGSTQVAQALPGGSQRLPTWWLLAPQQQLLPSVWQRATLPPSSPNTLLTPPSSPQLANASVGQATKAASGFTTQAHWRTAWSTATLYPWQTTTEAPATVVNFKPHHAPATQVHPKVTAC